MSVRGEGVVFSRTDRKRISRVEFYFDTPSNAQAEILGQVELLEKDENPELDLTRHDDDFVLVFDDGQRELDFRLGRMATEGATIYPIVGMGGVRTMS